VHAERALVSELETPREMAARAANAFCDRIELTAFERE
jgi:hypothetical protein